MQLYQGRPESCADRLPKECRTYDFLDKLGISYTRADHEAAMTIESCLSIDAAMGASICKNLLLCNRQCTTFYLLMMPGDKPFKTKELSAQIGSSRLSFADGKYMEEFLDITPGSLSVLGLMNDRDNRVQLLMDEDLLSWDVIGMHPCINTSSLWLKTRDLLDVVIPATNHPCKTVKLSGVSM